MISEHAQEQWDLYAVIMRCLDSAPYAGEEFQQRAHQWLEDSQSVTHEERVAGWQKMDEEYERLCQPYWDAFWRRIEKMNQKLAEKKIVQRELFA